MVMLFPFKKNLASRAEYYILQHVLPLCNFNTVVLEKFILLIGWLKVVLEKNMAQCCSEKRWLCSAKKKRWLKVVLQNRSFRLLPFHIQSSYIESVIMVNKMHVTATAILLDDCSQSLTSSHHHIMLPT